MWVGLLLPQNCFPFEDTHRKIQCVRSDMQKKNKIKSRKTTPVSAARGGTACTHPQTDARSTRCLQICTHPHKSSSLEMCFPRHHRYVQSHGNAGYFSQESCFSVPSWTQALSRKQCAEIQLARKFGISCCVLNVLQYTGCRFQITCHANFNFFAQQNRGRPTDAGSEDRTLTSSSSQTAPASPLDGHHQRGGEESSGWRNKDAGQQGQTFPGQSREEQVSRSRV